jgi:hypothetical protein
MQGLQCFETVCVVDEEGGVLQGASDRDMRGPIVGDFEGMWCVREARTPMLMRRRSVCYVLLGVACLLRFA